MSKRSRYETFTRIAQLHKQCIVCAINRRNHKTLFVGSIPEIAQRCGLSEWQVIGFAEWGKPTKKLEHYYLTYSVHCHSEENEYE